jgi:hypothetical protein
MNTAILNVGSALIILWGIAHIYEMFDLGRQFC